LAFTGEENLSFSLILDMGKIRSALESPSFEGSNPNVEI
jgi:hypothetical protein